MTNITLHAATENVRELLDQIDPDTGELPAEYEAARALVERKAVAVVAYILETERQADYVAAYSKELAARAKTIERRTTWLRTYLADHMRSLGITEIRDDRGLFSAALSIGRDKRVDVFDAAQVPDEYMRTKITREPDKAGIKAADARGETVPGARVVTIDRLTIK